MRAPRVAACLCLLTAALLVLAPPSSAEPQTLASPDVPAALERIAGGGWRPILTDPEWLAVRAAVDRELRASPQGDLAARVRTAAVRIEAGVSPLVADGVANAAFAIDTRPRFSTAVALPYFVVLHASLDGGQWTLVAAADSGATCSARAADVEWAAPVAPGFHHVALVADVYHLQQPSTRQAPRCGIRQHQRTEQGRDALETRPDEPSLPARVGIALSHERRTLAGLSFGLVDPQVQQPPGRDRDDARHGPDGTEHSVFVRVAQRVSASALDERLAPIPFERWLEAVEDVTGKRDTPPSPWWVPTGFCNADEGLWYRGRGSSGIEEAWPADSDRRREPRAICATALVPVVSGVLTVRLRVGTVVEDTAAWVIETPAFYEAFVAGGIENLDIPSLDALPRLVHLRRDEWPRPDVSVSLAAGSSPTDAVATGSPLRLDIRIQNIGAQDARYVHGTLVGGCSARPNQRFDILTSVAAGDTVTIERFIAPSGPSICASIVLFVYAPARLGGGFRTEFGDAFPDDNVAVFAFGPAAR